MDDTAFAGFRVAAFHTFVAEAAVLSDLVDSLLATPRGHRPIDLTLALPFQRRWASFYKGFQRGRIDRRALRGLCCAYAPRPAPAARCVLAVDSTSILRLLSPTAPNRGYVHTVASPETARPVGLGWHFALLVVVPDPPSSWTHVLDCTRIPTCSTPRRLAVCQLRRVVPLLGPTRPLVLGDRYYGSAAFVREAQTLPADYLLRIQTHRVFYRPAPPPAPHRRGPHPQKGTRFQPKDPTTHGPPDLTAAGVDARGRPVTLAAWQDLGFADDRAVRVTVVRCARQDGPDTRRDPRTIWLVWASPDPVTLAQVPDWYARRFSLEHGLRVDKQTFGWADLRLRTTSRFQRWTDLVMLAHNLLGLARALEATRPFPWNRETIRPRTPQQVHSALPRILAKLSTPPPAPQLRGKSPGRAVGCHPTPAPRYPIVYKAAKRAAPASPHTAHAPPDTG